MSISEANRIRRNLTRRIKYVEGRIEYYTWKIQQEQQLKAQLETELAAAPALQAPKIVFPKPEQMQQRRAYIWEQHQKGVRSVDIASALGIAPNIVAQDLWKMKTGRVKVPEEAMNK